MDAWPYCPQNSISESLEWLTDVQRCRSAEYRACLRIKPRQELHYTFKMTPAQFGQAKLLALALGASQLLVPLWMWCWEPGAIAQGATRVHKDTSDPYALTKNGSSVMLWESPSKYEVHAVSVNSMDPGDPYVTLGDAVGQAFSNPVVLPLRVGEFLQEFEATRSTAQLVETTARFRVQSGDDYSQQSGALYSAETYDSHPVITDRSLVASGVREQFERQYQEVDSVVGGAYRYPTFTSAEKSGQMSWYATSRAEMRSLLYWLHSRKGQWKSFWVPSWNGDLTVTHEIAASDTSIEIADIGFRTKATFPADIRILAKDGQRIYCRVTGAIAGSTGKEVLGLAAEVGTQLYTWNIAEVCTLTLSRFSSDRIEINSGARDNITATAPIVEVPL